MYNKGLIYELIFQNCQALFISLSLSLSYLQSLNLSSLRDSDRADTIVSFHPPTNTTNFLRTLELAYTQVHLKNRVNWGHYSTTNFFIDFGGLQTL